MIRREIKTFSVKLRDGASYEAKAPIGLLQAMIENNLCSRYDAEAGRVDLPESCVFTAEVELSERDAEAQYIYLEACGILAKGEIFFNGRSCGIVNSPFRTYLFDVADKASAGKNVLEVRCADKLEPKRYLTEYGERANEYGTAENVADFAVLRAAAIYVSDCAFIKDVKVRQEHIDGRVNLYVSADTVGAMDDVRIVASLSAPSGKIYFGGAYEDEIKINVTDPELWWPRGYGAQPLYKLTVTLYHGADVADVYEKKIGLRTVELSLPEHETPAFKVNGIKIFPRGATYVKHNAIATNISGESLEHIIKSAVSANMNTLSVFDGNIPLSDSFYDLCDKYGLLIWQSLTLPYIAPPAASVFASGVTDSVGDNVSRLASHPSVSLFFLAFAETSREMMRLFCDSIDEFRVVSLKILAPVLNRSAIDIPFVENPKDLFKHDERYLFEKDASFADGTLYSLPSEYTLKSYIPNDEYNLFSYSSETQTNVHECVRMLENTVRYMKMPYGMSETVYATELAAAIELSRSIKKARRSENCSSAVLRQLSDGKRTVSASLIDYFGKPKAAMKFVAEANAPVSLDIRPCVNNTEFVLSNLDKKEYVGRLFYALYDTDGKCYVEKNVGLSLDVGLSEVVEAADFSRYVENGQRRFYILYELYNEKGIIASGSEHFVPIKYFEFRDPKITAEISGIGKRFTIKLNSSWYAPAVKIDFEGLNVNFSDNFINLYGKTPVVITMESADVVTLSELQDKLKILSPYHIGR